MTEWYLRQWPEEPEPLIGHTPELHAYLDRGGKLIDYHKHKSAMRDLREHARAAE